MEQKLWNGGILPSLFNRKTLLGAMVAGVLLNPAHLLAKVSEEESAKLGTSLTPVGAIKAGNEAGTIPEWTGGIQTAPEGYEKGKLHVDPFGSDKARFTITAENMGEHADKLTAGQKAMFDRYKDSFKMIVYPTRRSASYPEYVYKASKENALSAELTSNGNGIKDAKVTSPFPIPQTGLEVLWNHTLRWRGGQLQREVGQAAPTGSGSYVMTRIEETIFLPYNQEGATIESVENRLAFFLQTVKAPARLAGAILLVHETLDQNKEPRLAWTYNPGQRRVRRAPNIAFDYPGTASDNQRTTDQYDMFNGSPERYDWKLVGKKEMYVPYNAFKIHAEGVDSNELLQTGHINQDYSRYELHRVWVVEGTIKEGTSHIYAKRTFYVDEDTWTILAADQYDGRGNIWRVSENHTINYYEVPATFDTLITHYDVLNGRYLAYGFNNSGPVDNFNIDVSKSDFTPQRLRRKGRR